MQNKGYLWGAVIAVVIMGGVVLLRANKATAPSPTASSTGMGTTTVDLGNGQFITLPPGATLHEEGTTSAAAGVTPPSLNGAMVINQSLASDVQAALRTNEQTLIAQLKAAPTRIDLWLKLGAYRKIAGDYEGAQTAWQYVINSGPSNIAYIAYGNLAELNLDLLKNYPKAEADYKTAISLNPSVIDYYRQLFLMYTGLYKNDPKAAADIVAQGLKANPNNPDLLQMQAQLKK